MRKFYSRVKKFSSSVPIGIPTASTTKIIKILRRIVQKVSDNLAGIIGIIAIILALMSYNSSRKQFNVSLEHSDSLFNTQLTNSRLLNDSLVMNIQGLQKVTDQQLVTVGKLLEVTERTFATYKEELSKAPKIELEVFITGMVSDSLIVFDSTSFSGFHPIRFNLKNTGNEISNSAKFMVFFNENVKVIWFKSELGKSVRMHQYLQMFTLDTINFNIPPSVRMQAFHVMAKFLEPDSVQNKPILIGSFTTSGDGGNGSFKDIYLNYVNHKFTFKDNKSNEVSSVGRHEIWPL